MHKLAFILLVIGGLNWAVFGLFDWDIGELFGDSRNTVAVIIYILFGLAALVELFTHKGRCKECSAVASSSVETPVS